MGNLTALQYQAGLSVKNFTIPTPDGFSLPIRLYRPAPEAKILLHLYYYIHGGGFLFGSLESSDYECRRVCIANQIAVLSVNYRHTDTHSYLTKHNDAWYALEYATAHAAEWEIDVGKIIIAGESAGANLAAAVVMRAKKNVFKTLHASHYILKCCLTFADDANFGASTFKSFPMSSGPLPKPSV